MPKIQDARILIMATDGFEESELFGPLGILKERDQLVPKRQSWFRSARNWVTQMDAIPKNEKQRA